MGGILGEYRSNQQNTIDSRTAEETVGEWVDRGRNSVQNSFVQETIQLGSLFGKAGVRIRTELIRWWRAGGKRKAQSNS